MFQHAFQSGTHLEVFDSKGNLTLGSPETYPNWLVNKEKDKNYEKLFKITNPNGVTKNFDKITKGYIYELDDAMKTKMHFPKNDKQELGLVQHFLVLQLFIPEGVPFSLEIVISDTTKNKRRLNFTSSVKNIDKTYFHAKIPVESIKRGVWLNLSIDLLSFFDLFKGQTFRSIDSFVLGAVCKLRKIFTMKHPLVELASDDEFITQLPDSQLVPKTQNFTSGVSYCNQTLTLDVVQKTCMMAGDPKDYDSSDESFSKNSTNISQALKIQGLHSNMKDRKTGTSYSYNATNTGLYSRQGDSKNMKTQQMASKANITGYHENDKRISTAKEREVLNSSLIGRKAPKRNNLVANYNIENEVPENKSDEEDFKMFDSPSKVFEESASIQITSPKPMLDKNQSTQRRTASIGPKNKHYNSKAKHSPRPNIHEEEEEEKDTKLEIRSHAIQSLKPKNKVEERISRYQKGSTAKKQPEVSQSKNEGNLERSPFSRRATSATSKYMVNDSKQATHSNPWGQNAKASKTNLQQQATPKGMYQSPRPTLNAASHRNEPKNTTPQPSTSAQKRKNHSPPRRPGAKDLTKTAMSGSSERFNTTGKLSNQRYEVHNHGDPDLLDQGPVLEEIESIEENLEYEITSNASNVNGSRGFSDFKEKPKPYKNNNKYSPSPVKNNKFDLQSSSKRKQDSVPVPNVYNIAKHNLEEFDDSLNNLTPTNKALHFDNIQSKKQDAEEVKKIHEIENQVNNAAQMRPYSPPYKFAHPSSNDSNSTIITKKNNEVVVLGKPQQEETKDTTFSSDKNKEMLEVVYDPVWNCYYHPKTNTYYELKE